MSSLERRRTVVAGQLGENEEIKLELNAESTIGTLFQGLDVLYRQETFYSQGTKRKKRNEKVLTHILELILQRAERKPWPLIFHERMAENFDILDEKRIAFYKEVFKWHYDNQDMANKKHKHKQLVVDLLDFFETHRHDPDNALVGLSLSKLALSKLAPWDEASPDRVLTMTGSKDSTFTRDHLMSEILRWSYMKPDDVVHEVFRFAAKVRAAHGFQRGDLVAVRLKQREGPSKPIFARVVKQVDRSVIVRVTPEEVGAKSIPVQNAQSITTLQPWLGSVSTMLLLVDDPIETYSTDMSQEIRNRCHHFLQENGIDVEMLERLKLGEITFEHFEPLRKMSTLVSEIVDDKDQRLTKFLAETKAYFNQRIAEFASEVDQSIIFKPSREQQMKMLSKIPHMAEKMLRSLVETCRQTVKELETSMEELIKGTTKQQLTEWWLNLIESKVERFLMQKNFKFSAIPENYLDEPTKDISGLRSNLALLQEILKPSDDCLQLINGLKNTIYPKIETFCQNTIVMLARAVGMETTTDLTLVEAKYAEKKAAMSPENILWIDNTCKDVHYLMEMKRMEDLIDTQSVEQKKEVEMTSVVPISGLVMCRFMIYSNMLHTCIDIYNKHHPSSAASHHSSDAQQHKEAPIVLKRSNSKSDRKELKTKQPVKVDLAEHTEPSELVGKAEAGSHNSASVLDLPIRSEVLLDVHGHGITRAASEGFSSMPNSPKSYEGTDDEAAESDTGRRNAATSKPRHGRSVKARLAEVKFRKTQSSGNLVCDRRNSRDNKEKAVKENSLPAIFEDPSMSSSQRTQLQLALQEWASLGSSEGKKKKARKSKHNEEKRDRRRHRRIKRTREILLQFPRHKTLELMFKEAAFTKLLLDFKQFCKTQHREDLLAFCLEAETYKQLVAKSSQALRDKFWKSAAFQDVVSQLVREQVDGEIETCPSLLSFRRAEERVMDDLAQLIPAFLSSDKFQPDSEFFDAIESFLKEFDAVASPRSSSSMS